MTCVLLICWYLWLAVSYLVLPKGETTHTTSTKPLSCGLRLSLCRVVVLSLFFISLSLASEITTKGRKGRIQRIAKIKQDQPKKKFAYDLESRDWLRILGWGLEGWGGFLVFPFYLYTGILHRDRKSSCDRKSSYPHNPMSSPWAAHEVKKLLQIWTINLDDFSLYMERLCILMLIISTLPSASVCVPLYSLGTAYCYCSVVAVPEQYWLYVDKRI